MNYYNDFPILSNEQYFNLNAYYSSKEPNTPSNDIANKIQFCIKSLIYMQKNFNLTIQKQITAVLNTLNNCKSSLTVLYPQIKYQNNKVTDNLFYVLAEIISINSTINNLANRTDKKYYTKVLLKLNNNISNSMYEFLFMLSKQDIKFFKFI